MSLRQEEKDGIPFSIHDGLSQENRTKIVQFCLHCDHRKMFCVKAGSWHQLMDGKKGRRPQLQFMTGQGTGDRDTIQGG